MTLKEAVDRIYARTKPEGGCLVTTGSRNNKGYGQMDFRGRTHLQHRLVLEYYMGPCPPGMEARHLCGQGHEGCVTASHLRWGTRAENVADRARHGRLGRRRYLYGERHQNAKHSDEVVRLVCERYANGETQVSLAREYGVNASTVSMWVSGKRRRMRDGAGEE